MIISCLALETKKRDILQRSGYVPNLVTGLKKKNYTSHKINVEMKNLSLVCNKVECIILF